MSLPPGYSEDIFQDMSLIDAHSARPYNDDPLDFEVAFADYLRHHETAPASTLATLPQALPRSNRRDREPSSPLSIQAPSSSLSLEPPLSISPALTQHALHPPTNQTYATSREATSWSYTASLPLNHSVPAPVAESLAPDASATHADALDQLEHSLAQTSYPPPTRAGYFSLPSPVVSENDATPTAAAECAALFSPRKPGRPPKRKATEADEDDGASGPSNATSDINPRRRKVKRMNPSTHKPMPEPEPEQRQRRSAPRRSADADPLPITRDHGVARSSRVSVEKNSLRISRICGYHYPGTSPHPDDKNNICGETFTTADDFYRHEIGHRQTESQSYLEFCTIDEVMNMSQIQHGTLVEIVGEGNKSERINWAQAKVLNFKPLPYSKKQRLRAALLAVGGEPASLAGKDLELFRSSAHYLAQWWANKIYCCTCGEGRWSRPDCLKRHRGDLAKKLKKDPKKDLNNHQVTVRWRVKSSAIFRFQDIMQ